MSAQSRLSFGAGNPLAASNTRRQLLRLRWPQPSRMRHVELTSKVSTSGARPRLRRMAVAALLVAAVAATTLGIYWLFVRPPREKALLRVPFHEMNISRLTTSGKITHAAISPDGKYVADVTSDAEGDSVWVRNIAAPTNMRIAGPAASEYVWVTFAPDGDSVYYLALDRDKGDTDLYRVPLLGGPPSKVAVRHRPGCLLARRETDNLYQYGQR